MGALYKIDVLGKCQRDTCLNETLAFADCERSEQKDNRLLCLIQKSKIKNPKTRFSDVSLS